MSVQISSLDLNCVGTSLIINLGNSPILSIDLEIILGTSSSALRDMHSSLLIAFQE